MIRHPGEWVSYCSHVAEDGSQHCTCAPSLEETVEALRGIVRAAITYGVNDEVAEAIAHAEVVAGTRGEVLSD